MSRVMDKFTHYLLKRNIIKISKIEDSFFSYKRLDKKIILNHDIISLNYLSDSPYSSSETRIIAITEKDGFYLWFNKGECTHCLPEALLIFRQVLEKYSNVIFIVNDQVAKIIVIKNRQLVSSFSKHTITQKDLLLIKDEYNLTKTVTLDKNQYISFFKDSFKYLKLNDILSILNIKLDIKSFFNKIVLFSALPILISTVISFILIALYSNYLDNQNSQLSNHYKKSQLLTLPIKKKIDREEDLNMIFNTLSEEFIYEDKVMAISSIVRLTKDLNMTLFYINSYDKNMDFIVKTEESSNIPTFTKKLFETELFSNVKNVSSQKIKGKLIKVTMNAILKERD